MIDRDKRFAIIGGGIAGLSTAWFLQEEGYDNVTIIERSVDTTMEASGLNSGLVRHYHPDKVVRADLIRSVELLSRYQERHSASFFEESPSLWLFRSDTFRELDENTHDFLEVNTISPDQVPDRLKPELTFGQVWVRFENDGLLDAVEFGDQLHREVKQSNVDIRTSTSVQSGEKRGDDWLLNLNENDELATDVIVNAAGVWANDVAERLGLDPRDYEPVSRHLFFTKEQLIPESNSYYMDYNQRFFFRRTEEGTLISYCDEQPVEPGETKDVDFPRDHLDNVIGGSYPDLQLDEIDQYWSGQYAMTPDYKPMIDTDPTDPSVIWATGLNDFGMSYGLRTGERVMDQLRPGEYVYDVGV